MDKYIKNIDKTFRLEKDLQKYCLDFVKDLSKTHQIHAINVPASSYGRNGISDILLCIKGLFVAVELKNGRGGYGATANQLRFIDNINEAGGYAGVVYTFREFYELVMAALDVVNVEYGELGYEA